MKIALSSDPKFYSALQLIKDDLVKKGYGIFISSMKEFDLNKDVINSRKQFDLINENFRNIDNSDAIYVANYNHMGIEGYFAGNSFLEIGRAFEKNKGIFLMNPIPKKFIYRDALEAMQPIVIGRDWEKLDEYFRKKGK